MQPSEITAHEIDSIGPKLPPETHIFSLRHLTTGADNLAKAGLRGERLSRDLAPWPAYRAVKQFVGITFRIEWAQRLDCLSRCFPKMRLVNTLSGCVACFLIFFDNINQLPKRYVVTGKVTRIIKKCHRSSNKSYKSSLTLYKVVLKNCQYRFRKLRSVASGEAFEGERLVRRRVRDISLQERRHLPCSPTRFLSVVLYIVVPVIAAQLWRRHRQLDEPDRLDLRHGKGN
jgi:hypothetical protein